MGSHHSRSARGVVYASRAARRLAEDRKYSRDPRRRASVIYEHAVHRTGEAWSQRYRDTEPFPTILGSGMSGEVCWACA